MTAAARPRRSRSGPSIPESQRIARVVSVRLSPETIARLDAYAEAHALSRSAAVEALVAAAPA